MHRLTINNPDSGTFRIQFTRPDLERSAANRSDEMTSTMSGNEIRDRIKGYFNSVGLNTSVTKK
jgi:hypothetical protein